MIRTITVNAVAILPKERKKQYTVFISTFFLPFLSSFNQDDHQSAGTAAKRQGIHHQNVQPTSRSPTDQSYLHQHSDVGAYVNKREARERPPFQPQIPLHHNHQPNNQPINQARTCTAFNTPLTSPHPPHLFERNTCGADVVTPAHT